MARAKPVEDDSNVVSFPGKSPEGETVRADLESGDQSVTDPALAQPAMADGDAEDVRIGTVIVQAREALGLERAVLAEELRISARYLTAIETMNIGPIPQGYLVPYLRTYARRLGLDAEDTVRKFSQQCGAVDEISKLQPIEPIVERKGAITLPLIIGASVSLLVMLLAGGLFVVSKLSDAPEAVIVTEAGPVNGARQSLFDEAPATGAASATLPLTLTATRSAWIEVRGADGTIFRSRVMAEGEVYHPRVQAGWTVSARDGGAFEWHVGDVSVGLLGPEGAPVYAVSVDAKASAASAAISSELAATGSPNRAQ